LEEFRQDIIHKDAYALTKLMPNPNVLFHSIDDQKDVDSARKYNDKVTDSGVEHWQVRKIDGQWKILSLPGRAMTAADSQQLKALRRTRRAYAW
jgi:hypothetical protein